MEYSNKRASKLCTKAPHYLSPRTGHGLKTGKTPGKLWFEPPPRRFSHVCKKGYGRGRSCIEKALVRNSENVHTQKNLSEQCWQIMEATKRCDKYDTFFGGGSTTASMGHHTVLLPWYTSTEMTQSCPARVGVVVDSVGGGGPTIPTALLNNSFPWAPSP